VISYKGQITYLRKELVEAQPIKRITKKVKERVIKHYCYMNGLGNEDVEIEFSEKDLQSMCRAFVDTENEFRLRYRTGMSKRDLNGWSSLMTDLMKCKKSQ
jgi:hypothetical protein